MPRNIYIFSWTARGQNLVHIQKIGFLLYSFLKVQNLTTTCRKAFIVAPWIHCRISFYSTTPEPRVRARGGAKCQNLVHIQKIGFFALKFSKSPYFCEFDHDLWLSFLLINCVLSISLIFFKWNPNFDGWMHLGIAKCRLPFSSLWLIILGCHFSWQLFLYSQVDITSCHMPQ